MQNDLINTCCEIQVDHRPLADWVGRMFVCLQGYLAHKETQPPRTTGLCLGAHGGPRGLAVSYKRGTPVALLQDPRAVRVRILECPLRVQLLAPHGGKVLPLHYHARYKSYHSLERVTHGVVVCSYA